MKRGRKPSAAATAAWRFRRPIIVLLAIIAVAAGGFGWLKGRRADTLPTTALNEPAPAPASLGFEKLKGKWQRPDGGYIVEIRSVDPGGRMDAAYFNPRSINVAKAQAAQEGAVTKVFVELRDKNYPGSTYTLAYEAQTDQLSGVYYQAALQQQFEVVFKRMK